MFTRIFYEIVDFNAVGWCLVSKKVHNVTILSQFPINIFIS